MIDISKFGLSDEVVLLLQERAQRRGVELDDLLRDLIHVGLSHDLAAEQVNCHDTVSIMGDWDSCELVDMLDPEDTTEGIEAELYL